MNGRLTRVVDLEPPCRAKMLALFRRHFRGVSLDDFERDLQAKDYVLLLFDDIGELAGFTSFAHETVVHAGVTRGVIYSGDTLMSPTAWGSSVLMPAWIRSVHEVHAAHSRGPLWWLLLTSGYRTYRFLPVLFEEFWPCHSKSTPAGQRTLLETLARHRYGADFDSETGLVRFARPQRLRGELSGVPSARLHCPHVRFFERSNPGHSAGDELVCITDLSRENLTPAGRRMWARGERLDLDRLVMRSSTDAIGRRAVAGWHRHSVNRGEAR